MTVSALAICVQRVLAAEDVVSLLGSPDEVTPVLRRPKGLVPAITVNRVFERCEDGESVAGLALTVYAATVKEIEAVGAALVDALDGSTFDFADLFGIEFSKAGPDVTGHDSVSGLFLRQIEFVISCPAVVVP